jgi:DNA-binding NarL/FixJ family response regulator
VNVDGLMLCDDLIFFSRVSGAARAAGLAVKQTRTPAALLDAAQQHAPGGVILDLQTEDLDLPLLLTSLKGICPAMPRTVAFGSHVQADVLHAARDAGCDVVLPRSQFVEMLDGRIQEWLVR